MAKNKIMKFMGMGLAVATSMATIAPVMAAVPSATDGDTITIQGIASNDSATVKIYRVVEPVYNEKGLVKYQVVNGITIANIEEPTSDEVASAVAAILANPENFKSYELVKNDSGAYVKDDVAPGEYIAIVSGSNTTVYNPSVVSVNYTDANEGDSTVSGSVNLGTTFTYGSEAYMKSSTPSIDKNIIVDGSKVKGDAVDAHGTNTTAGDEITFQIDSQLPSYKMTGTGGAVYQDPIYRISDKLDATFDNITEIKVMNAAGTDLVLNQDYTLTGGVGHTNFVVQFTRDYLMAHGNESIKITYKTVLNDTGDNNNYAENLNVAKLEYSNDPTDKDSLKVDKKKTYHYTFSVDGIIDGQTVTDNGTYDEKTGFIETHELNKVGQATKDITTEWTEKVKGENIKTYSSVNALEGAEFTLYTDAALANPVAVSTSDAYGHIPFTGLDEGTYYMKETEAPASYTLNDNIYKITIDAILDDEGVLESYAVNTEVSVDKGVTFAAAGSITYRNTKTVNADVESDNFGRVVNTIVTENDIPVEIVNTRLAALPSTGGVGTYVFTISGVMMVCGFAAVAMKNRKEKNR